MRADDGLGFRKIGGGCYCMDPIFACFVVGVLIVFLTLNTVVFNCACNLIGEHGLNLLFETIYEHS
jgi:hypothetical protein